jgi:hypothetical protein
MSAVTVAAARAASGLSSASAEQVVEQGPEGTAVDEVSAGRGNVS